MKPLGQQGTLEGAMQGTWSESRDPPVSPWLTWGQDRVPGHYCPLQPEVPILWSLPFAELPCPVPWYTMAGLEIRLMGGKEEQPQEVMGGRVDWRMQVLGTWAKGFQLQPEQLHLEAATA